MSYILYSDQETAAVPLPPPSLSQMADDYTQNTSTSQLHDNTIVDVTVTQSHCSASGSSNSEASAESKIKTEIEIGDRDHEDDVISFAFCFGG